MKITIWTFAEDTNEGTNSYTFGSEEALHEHMRKVIVDSYGEHVKEVNGVIEVASLSHADQMNAEWDMAIIDSLNDGDVEQAFCDWNEQSGFRKHLDTYNWDEQTLEIPMPPEVQALVDDLLEALQELVKDVAVPQSEHPWAVQQRQAHEKARAAITKATAAKEAK